ncbi:MAG: DUF1488 family protein [Acetobacteraceae bacterium]|nr:DUF1488 family protein [Acetobacteraceae bacterium]
MPTELPLMIQTAYAELLDRARAAAFSEAFPSGGTFIPKVIRDRRYWYFQEPTALGRGQTYVGPETQALLAQINSAREARKYSRDQRSLVAMLVRGGNLPRPLHAIGNLVAALEGAGVFRLRAVLVGTVAYQTYAMTLGVRLPAAIVQTNDVDVAQFADVSVAMDDKIGPMPDILRRADDSFRPEPHLDHGRAVSYVAASGLRVDFLTPNRGPDTEVPQPLPALGTDAQPLRFLDFLIRDPEQAVLLHGNGVLVSVPAPERFALHKLIVARRRRPGDPKQQKDLLQASALLDVLVERRPLELRAAWNEAFKRGKAWRRLIGEGLGQLRPAIRERALRAVEAPRSVVPGLNIEFVPERAAYDGESEEVRFHALPQLALAGGVRETVACTITRDLLMLLEAAPGLDSVTGLAAFRRNRDRIEQVVTYKYLHQPVAAGAAVRLTVADMTLFEKSASLP